MTIKVLHVLGNLNVGGVETWLMQLLRKIDPNKVRMDFLLQNPTPGVYEVEAKSLGARIFRIGSWRGSFQFGSRFRSLLSEEGYHVVHSHSYLNSGYILRQAKRVGVPVRIAHSHNCIPTAPLTNVKRFVYESWMKRGINRSATNKLAISIDSAKSLFGRSCFEDPRTAILYYGLDLDSYSERSVIDPSVRNELGLRDEEFIVGNIGKFTSQKNHSFFCAIAKEILLQEGGAKFLLVGDGPRKSEIEQIVADMGISRSFVFAGIRTDIPKVLCNAFDVFLFPSLFEGMGIAAIEAQAAGIPCVISDGLPSELDVCPELIHRISLEQTPEYWARKVIALRRKKLDRFQLRDRLRSSRFSIDCCLESLTEVYSDGS